MLPNSLFLPNLVYDNAVSIRCSFEPLCVGYSNCSETEIWRDIIIIIIILSFICSVFQMLNAFSKRTRKKISTTLFGPTIMLTVQEVG